MRRPLVGGGARTRWMVAVMAVGTVAGGAGLAAAHDATFASTVSLHFYDAAAPGAGPSKCGESGGPDCFYGRVSSALAACESGRTVKVFKKLDAPPPGKLRRRFIQLVGMAVSDRDGKWVVQANDPGTGDYYARVLKRTIERPGHVHVCRADTTSVRHFDDFG